MIPSKARTEFEDSIHASCRSLFFTSAIPDLVRKEGTTKRLTDMNTAASNCRLR